MTGPQALEGFTEDKHAVESVTNWVAVLSPILTAVLPLFGVAIPGGALAPVIVSVVQGAITLIARNRPGGGGSTTWRV